MFLKISKILQENICARAFSFFATVCNYIKKEALTKVFSCEYCEIFYKK